MSRPSSSHGMKFKSKKILSDGDVSPDESNWGALAQGSPAKATHHTALSDEDDDSLLMPDKPLPKPVPKPVTKAQPAPKAKETVALKPKKAPAVAQAAAAPKPLSPAAKAYAAKQAKAGAQSKAGALKPAPKKKAYDSDDEDAIDDIANDILSDGDSPVKADARPSRRAAATKSRYVEDDDDEDEDEDDDESEAGYDDDESD